MQIRQVVSLPERFRRKNFQDWFLKKLKSEGDFNWLL
jgi:hypothetical protein